MKILTAHTAMANLNYVTNKKVDLPFRGVLLKQPYLAIHPDVIAIVRPLKVAFVAPTGFRSPGSKIYRCKIVRRVRGAKSWEGRKTTTISAAFLLPINKLQRAAEWL